MAEQVNVVLVGYGLSCRCFHLPLLRLVPDLRLHGVVARRGDVRGQAVAREACRAFPSLEAALAEKSVDLVVLATPSGLHAEQAIAALEAGKHVIVDKPMAATTADADRMIAAARRADRMLSVYHNRRWDGDFVAVRELVGREAVGPLRLVEVAWQRPNRAQGWRGTVEAGGGRLLDLGPHLVDQALQLIDAPLETVYARIDGDASTVEDVALITLGFAGGVTYVIDVCSPVNLPVKPRWFLMGRDGCAVKFGEDPQEVALRDGHLNVAPVPPEEFFRLRRAEGAEESIPVHAGKWQGFYENIADVLLRDRPLTVTAEAGRQCIAVLDAARKSAATGEVVRLSA